MTDNTKILELPSRMERGEVRFSINLALIDDVPALYQLLHRLGFTKPELALMHYRSGPEVHLLLYRHVFSELLQSPDAFYEHEQQVLANAINTDAIRFTCGLTRAVEPIAA